MPTDYQKQIAKACADGKTVEQAAELFNVAKSTMYRHLAELSSCGWLLVERLPSTRGGRRMLRYYPKNRTNGDIVKGAFSKLTADEINAVREYYKV